jgi:hypothetical protein
MIRGPDPQMMPTQPQLPHPLPPAPVGTGCLGLLAHYSETAKADVLQAFGEAAHAVLRKVQAAVQRPFSCQSLRHAQEMPEGEVRLRHCGS